MANSPTYVKLSREVRFGLHPEGTFTRATDAANSFAGQPLLAGLVPFVAVTVTIAGPIDPETGMVVNIKVIDLLVREYAVGLLRTFGALSPQRTGDLVKELFDCLDTPLAAKRQVLEGISLALSPYLSIATFRQEKPMVRLSQRFEFSASHRLHAAGLSDAENREVFGRCNNPNGHGHNYELEVTVAGTPDAAGIILPIAELQKIVNENITDVFDHKHLNLDCPDFRELNPTVENIAQVLFRRLKPKIPAAHKLAMLRLWETPKTMCEYSE